MAVPTTPPPGAPDDPPDPGPWPAPTGGPRHAPASRGVRDPEPWPPPGDVPPTRPPGSGGGRRSGDDGAPDRRPSRSAGGRNQAQAPAGARTSRGAKGAKGAKGAPSKRAGSRTAGRGRGSGTAAANTARGANRAAPTRSARSATPESRGRAPAAGRRGATSSPNRSPARRRQGDGWARLAPVHDTEGPRIRLGVAWFCVALVGVMAAAAGAALVYAAVAGLAARQVVRAWRSPGWQADVAVGLAVVPPLAAVLGPVPGVGALALAGLVAIMVGLYEPLDGLDTATGRLAAAGVVLQAVMPVAVAAVAVVLVRAESPEAAVLLVGLVSAYEVGDYLVGSGASNPVEGPLAGGAALIVVGFPMAILLVQPFDVMGVALLGVAAACCPVGQWIASAVLPRPDARAPALRRMDSLLLLAPLWVIASGAL